MHVHTQVWLIISCFFNFFFNQNFQKCKILAKHLPMQENVVCLLLLYGTKDARLTISDLQIMEVLHGDIAWESEIVYRSQWSRQYRTRSRFDSKKSWQHVFRNCNLRSCRITARISTIYDFTQLHARMQFDETGKQMAIFCHNKYLRQNYCRK